MKKWFSLLLGDSKFVLISWVFLRGLALIYFAAFASMLGQILGLVGEEGILPLQRWLSVIAQLLPEDRFRLYPTLFWLNASDSALQGACIAGMVAAVLLFFNIADTLALILCYILYLSITLAGQVFTSFQWDIFLLEAGFLGIFLKWGSPVVLFLYRWLVARFMFMGGVVKLASGDPTWADLTALNYHYETQPLPSPLAYYASHFPEWFQKICTGGVLVIELIVPFFVFLPRPFRLFAAWCFLVLQSAIMLTGNYNFFNLLTILLCLFLFEDRDIAGLLPVRWTAWIEGVKPVAGKAAHACAGIWAAAVLTVNATSVWMYHAQERPAEPFKTLMQTVSAFCLVNNYGPFAVMTTRRNEIIVQGSEDGTNWHTYLFKYKPVKLDQPLTWNIPHQPRLDWQMWFAALEKPSMNSWFAQFMRKLQQGSPPVLALLRYNPFPYKPPLFVRALFYRYFFTSSEERVVTGRIWRREYLGVYWPPGLIGGH